MIQPAPAIEGKKKAAKKDVAASYNRFKEFEGKRYTGMTIGRKHRWYYDKGEWVEKKVTPDKWEFTYAVTKRRAGKAPEGSGAPVGTEYDWYVMAHQTVRKLNANDYTTSMAGFKFKIAHRRADNGKWSAGQRAQRTRLIRILEEMLAGLRAESLEESEPAPPAQPKRKTRAGSTGKKPKPASPRSRVRLRPSPARSRSRTPLQA